MGSSAPVFASRFHETARMRLPPGFALSGCLPEVWPAALWHSPLTLLCSQPIGCGDDYACTGVFPCWERFPKDCLERDGCHIGPACVHAACAGLVGEIECTALPGCYWSEADGGCQSSPATCGNRTEANCLEGTGCGWGQACTGQARPCSENQTAEECGLHMGCSWRRVPNLN